MVTYITFSDRIEAYEFEKYLKTGPAFFYKDLFEMSVFALGTDIFIAAGIAMQEALALKMVNNKLIPLIWSTLVLEEEAAWNGYRFPPH